MPVCNAIINATISMHNWDCNGSERCGYNVTSVEQNDADECVLKITHETPTKHYVDNISFDISSTASDVCSGTANSKSTPLSIKDYGTNYCNIYNILRVAAQLGVAYTDFDTSKELCTDYVEGQMAATCDKY
jgi:hypothetical protein